MVRPCLSAGCRARLLLLPHLPCQACPDGHPCTPANSSSGSQGGPAARALHGEKANGLEPPGPLRILSKSQFFPAPHSLSSFLINLSGSSQKHFQPLSNHEHFKPHDPAPLRGFCPTQHQSMGSRREMGQPKALSGLQSPSHLRK